ncbi:glycosyltransferase family 4 protein [Colwellia sp. MSW7]|uniref:Glycosyltransferase family 4 protein n=1 Tax=Colwellia maritima TaxID=2912588 RepID=A0ABS9X6I0_9GAMM|nr:glycosyltransferase family 4 protein [Colwellia maritima]MCI2285071.1 glycosyltransferase family 4 protein [Colwellia maritima]
MTKKILVVTNMYPNKKSPAAGIFVKKMTQQLQDNKDFSIELWVIPTVSNKLIAYCLFYFGFIIKLLKFRPKIVYCHFVSHTGLLGVLAKTLLGCKLVLNCHGTDVMNSIGGNKFKYKLNNYLFSCADKIIVPSAFLQSVVLKNFAVLSSKMFIYPSGGVFIPDDEANKNDNRQQAATVKIGYVGRLIESKGIKVLTSALSKLDHVELCVAGGGDISLVANNLNPKVKLTYLGEVPQLALREMYEQIDLLIFPTLLQESLGLTPLEAMAFSVPVIGSNIGAVSEYVVNEKTGFLITPGSVEELETAIVKFTKMTAEQRDVLKTNARHMAISYDEGSISHALVKLIRDLA